MAYCRTCGGAMLTERPHVHRGSEMTPTTDLLGLLDNRQMPDHAKPDVTLGELRALRAEAVAAERERLRGEVEALHEQYRAVTPDGYHAWDHETVLALLADPAEPEAGE